MFALLAAHEIEAACEQGQASEATGQGDGRLASWLHSEEWEKEAKQNGRKRLNVP